MAANRFKIPDLPDFFFEVKQSGDHPKSSTKKVNIDNISTSGIGLSESNEGHLPEVGDEILGTLVKGDNRVETKARVVHKTDKIVGCEFTDSLGQIESLVTDDLIRDLFPSLRNA